MSEGNGHAPYGWRNAKLGEICEIQLGKMLSPVSKRGIRPIAYLRNANVQWNRFDLRDIATMDFDEKEERKFLLRRGDLLVCEGGEPGRAAVWNGEIERCCYQKALHRLRPANGEVDPHFLMYRLWLGAFANEFSDSMTQARSHIFRLSDSLSLLSRFLRWTSNGESRRDCASNCRS